MHFLTLIFNLNILTISGAERDSRSFLSVI